MAGNRVVLNRRAFDEITLAEADGVFELAKRVLEVVHVPDAPVYGQGLVQGGGALAWAGGKKVGGTQIGGRAIRKPRGLRTPATEVVAIVGFGFPARFVELGTVDTPAQPFLSRAVNSVLPGAAVTISNATRRRLGGLRAYGGRS